MKIAFRADASRELGTGHVMRCRSLARSLRRRGAEIAFFCSRLPEWLIEELKSDGFRYVPLNDGQDEIESLLDRLKQERDHPFDWLVTDHYGWDERQELAAASCVQRLMVIDDLADRRHHCNLLLNQNVAAQDQRYFGLVPSKTRLLLGSRYALLREEFAAVRASVNMHDGRIRTLFVCFGGTDPTNETAKTLEALNADEFADLNVHVVVGRSHSRLDMIVEMCRFNPRIRLHIQSSQMARLMAESDLAICAGGTMTWERYCMGLPGLVIAVADNQIEPAKTSQRIGVDWYLGESARVGAEQVRFALLEAMRSPDRIRQGQRTAMNRVDGLGAERVADILFGTA